MRVNARCPTVGDASRSSCVHFSFIIKSVVCRLGSLISSQTQIAARHQAGGLSGEGMRVTEIRARELIAELDEASLSRVHMRAVLASGMGFFTDAYDLFVIGVASALITKDWGLSPGHLALLNSTMLFAAFVGAFVFGRFADVIGRKHVYWLVAAITIVGALGSAFAPSFWVVIAFRFVLGFGVGGDYPVSAVMVSEYANRKDRGKLVGMVFGTQALGLIIGPLIALALLGSGASNDLVWQVMLALGQGTPAPGNFLHLANR